MSRRWYVFDEEGGPVEFGPEPHPGGDEAFVLHFTCTNRETHKESRLAASVFNDAGAWLRTATHGPSMVVMCSDPRWNGETDSDDLFVEFRCSRCPRTPRIALLKWQSAMAGGLNPSQWPGGAANAVKDLSALPF